MPSKKPLPVELPRIDGDTQSRVKTNDDTLDDYAALIEDSGTDWPFPPIDVFHDGTDYFVADGFHRLLAAIRAKRGTIPCVIHNGGAFDARVFGMTANDRHGMRMTRADKRKCVEWLLDNGGKMTQKAIAEAAGVTSRTVKMIIADRNPTSITGKATPPKRDGKGKISPSTPISGGSDEEDDSSVSAQDEAERKHPDGERRGVACRNCGVDWWADDACAACLDPFEAKPEKGKAPPKKPPKKFDRPACFKKWEQAIGPVVRMVSKIASDVGESNCPSHEAISDHLEECTTEMAKWMGVKL
jgi:uncharacterized ParB-like nuclease family protein